MYAMLLALTIRLYGEPNDPSEMTSSIKNACFCLYMIVIYWPVFRPLMFVAGLVDGYATKRRFAKCRRMAKDRRTTREDFLKYLGEFYDEDGAASLADYFMERKVS